MLKAALALMATIGLGGVIMNAVSLATVHWVQLSLNPSLSAGLWERCQPICLHFTQDVAGYVWATRIFIIVALLVMFVGCLCGFLLVVGMSMVKMSKVASSQFFVAAFCQLIGMAVFTGQHTRTVFEEWGYSFALGWVVMPVALMLGVGYRLIHQKLGK